MTVFKSNELVKACDWLHIGNLLAYPTEAVWGIGCDPFNQQAVQQILSIKNRPIEKGMIVIAPNIDSIQPFLQALPENRQQAILSSWQLVDNQATTWLFPISSDLPVTIPDWVTGGRNSLAIRVTAHPSIAKLCEKLISPHNPYGFLISTSCNPSDQRPAKNLTQAQQYFGESVGYLRDKTLNFTQPSQIKDALTDKLMRM